MAISKRVGGIEPSLTLEITAKAKKMKAEGISVIGFGAGEPDFNTPDFIVNSAKEALDIGFTKYTPASGTIELRKAICEKLKKDNGLTYTENQIVVSSGAKGSLYHALATLIDEGDEVIIPSPYWLTYPELVKMLGGKCVFVKTKQQNDHKITVEQLKSAVTPKTKCLILNSPNNPTGSVYTKKELFTLAEYLVTTDIYVISDEIYEKLVYDGAEHYSIASYSEKMQNQTVVINGMSKSYSMTGWRLGYLAASTEVAKGASSMQSHTSGNANSITQYASVTALKGGENFIKGMQQVFSERRKLMIDLINGIKGVTFSVPMGAFYVFVDISHFFGKSFENGTINGSMDFANCALKRGVALVPGKAFGDDRCVRLSYAISKEDIIEGLKRLKAFTEELN